jgi:DNA-binding transcriptional ArsR family regulator
MLDSMRRFKAGIFQALGHPTRIALVEYLLHGEHSVGQLCDKVGIEQANASQHLAVLRNKHIVQTRKEGNQIFYSLRDPLLGKVLEALRQFFLSHVHEALEMLREEQHGAEQVSGQAGG